MKKIIASVVLTGALFQVPAHAQGLDNILSGMDFSFNGYGTAGIVTTNTSQAQFVRGMESSGATRSARANVDSILGVQAMARFNPWLSATVQVLNSSNKLTDTVAWAYLKVEPLENLSIKLGKTEMPLFAVSASRDINYSNIWLRAPNEVYSLANIEELRGGEITYAHPIGSTRLSLTGYAGKTVIVLSGQGSPADAKNVRGGALRWETEWVTLRGGIATTIVELPGIHDRYTFSSVGALVDHNNIIAQAEYVRRKSAGFAMVVNASGYYVLGGYRFGKVAPYVSYASTTKADAAFPIGISFDQDTVAVGVRWDAFRSADIKFQFERVDPKGTAGISFAQVQPGFGNSTVNALSLTLDFVFGG